MDPEQARFEAGNGVINTRTALGRKTVPPPSQGPSVLAPLPPSTPWPLDTQTGTNKIIHIKALGLRNH